MGNRPSYSRTGGDFHFGWNVNSATGCPAAKTAMLRWFITRKQPAALSLLRLCGQDSREVSGMPGVNIKMKGFWHRKGGGRTGTDLPKARIARMDLDTTEASTHFNRSSEIRDQEIDILVGTQMVTKGLDFDNVSLVLHPECRQHAELSRLQGF